MHLSYNCNFHDWFSQTIICMWIQAKCFSKICIYQYSTKPSIFELDSYTGVSHRKLIIFFWLAELADTSLSKNSIIDLLIY